MFLIPTLWTQMILSHPSHQEFPLHIQQGECHAVPQELSGNTFVGTEGGRALNKKTEKWVGPGLVNVWQELPGRAEPTVCCRHFSFPLSSGAPRNPHRARCAWTCAAPQTKQHKSFTTVSWEKFHCGSTALIPASQASDGASNYILLWSFSCQSPLHPSNIRFPEDQSASSTWEANTQRWWIKQW